QMASNDTGGERRAGDEPHERPERSRTRSADEVEARDRRLELGRKPRRRIDRPNSVTQVGREERQSGEVDAIARGGNPVVGPLRRAAVRPLQLETDAVLLDARRSK